MSNNTRETRQKFGSQAKKALNYLQEKRHKTLKFSQIYHEVLKLVKEQKKSLDIICLFESLGLLTRIDVDIYIFTGFVGIAQRLLEYQVQNSQAALQAQHLTSRKPQFRKTDNIVVFEEVRSEDKLVHLKPHLLAGAFFHQLFFGLIYANGKFTTKNQIEALVEEFNSTHKDISTRSFVPDMINVLSMLGFVERNESTEVVSYCGPDLRIFDERTAKKHPERAAALLRKEEQFFSTRDDPTNPTNSTAPQSIQVPRNGMTVLSNLQPSRQAIRNGSTEPINPLQMAQTRTPVPMHSSYLPDLSFGILKAKNWQFPIVKYWTIIGRGPSMAKKEDEAWTVDLDLGSKSVSRQHAVILYNFEERKWEIRCLSRKNCIKVDGEKYGSRDKKIFLADRSVIQVGPELFMFCIVEKNQ